MDAINAEFIRLLSGSGWNQSRAARELHLDTGTVSRYVNGETRPSLTVLKLFAELLGESIRLKDHNYTPAARSETRQLEPWESEALKSFRKIPPMYRRRFLEQLTALTETLMSASHAKHSTADDAGANCDGDRKSAGQTIQLLQKGVGQLPESPGKNVSLTTKMKSSHGSSTTE